MFAAGHHLLLSFLRPSIAFTMDFNVGDRVFYTRSNGVRVPATVVGFAPDGLVHLEYFRDAVKVVNRQCKVESISFAIPSADSPPPHFPYFVTHFTDAMPISSIGGAISDILFNPKYAGCVWKITVAVDHLGNIVWICLLLPGTSADVKIWDTVITGAVCALCENAPSVMSVVVHSVHNNIVPHIATPCGLF